MLIEDVDAAFNKCADHWEYPGELPLHSFLQCSFDVTAYSYQSSVTIGLLNALDEGKNASFLWLQIISRLLILHALLLDDASPALARRPLLQLYGDPASTVK